MRLTEKLSTVTSYRWMTTTKGTCNLSTFLVVSKNISTSKLFINIVIKSWHLYISLSLYIQEKLIELERLIMLPLSTYLPYNNYYINNLLKRTEKWKSEHKNQRNISIINIQGNW